MTGKMRRRDVITLLGGAAAWPLAARAQQSGAMRRIGVLTNRAADDPEVQTRYAAFLQGLQEAGWAVGRNMRIDVRWSGGDAGRIRAFAQELIALAPDVILATNTPTVVALQQVTRTVPIVFATVGDPVGAGVVDSLGRPGGNVTGFMNFEYSMSGKWPELLKQIAPGVMRAAILRDAANPAGIGQFSAIQAVAPSLGLEVSAVNVRDAGEIGRAIAAFARSANSGLVATTSAMATVHGDLIITLAARHKLPTVYGNRFSIVNGGGEICVNGGQLVLGGEIYDQMTINHRRCPCYDQTAVRSAREGRDPVLDLVGVPRIDGVHLHSE